VYQKTSKHLAIFLRGTMDPAGTADRVRDVVQSLDPTLPVFGAELLTNAVSGSLAARRFAMEIVALFALTTLLLAALGIYGVMSYTVVARTQEIGIRLALGAPRERMFVEIVGRGLTLAIAGTIVGVLCAAVVGAPHGRCAVRHWSAGPHDVCGRCVVIGHLNDIKEQPTVVPMAIAKRGAYVAFDHSGKPDDPRVDEYVKTIRTLVDAGLASRICLSSDFASERYLRKKGGPGIDMTITNFVPRLRRAGVDEATLRMILIGNPRRVLSFVARA
jgi:hypothetical protein